MNKSYVLVDLTGPVRELIPIYLSDAPMHVDPTWHALPFLHRSTSYCIWFGSIGSSHLCFSSNKRNTNDSLRNRQDTTLSSITS